MVERNFFNKVLFFDFRFEAVVVTNRESDEAIGPVPFQVPLPHSSELENRSTINRKKERHQNTVFSPQKMRTRKEKKKNQDSFISIIIIVFHCCVQRFA